MLASTSGRVISSLRSSNTDTSISGTEDDEICVGFLVGLLKCLKTAQNYGNRIFANSFRGNNSFLNLALFTVTFDLYFINLNSCRGNYSREETIQGRKLFAEIR